MTAMLQIPGGMQDTLPGECYARRALERKFRERFRRCAYREIETPILEYYDALSDATFGYRPEHVWKTFDRFGRVLALRPDSTIPAARLAAGSLKEEPLPLRLCYLQSASNYHSDTLSLLCEQPQAGVELMGDSSALSDAEVIALAVSCLEDAALADFQIELGHAAFFTGFMEEAGLTPEQTREVRGLVERKDALGLQLFLRACAVSESAAERLMRLPRLYGGEEILSEAEGLARNPLCLEAVARLREVIRLLRAVGCGADVTIDLGMAQEANYYSGVIFRGHARGAGQPILSGGRYDGLTARYGRPLPAVGFALSTKLLMIALERQGASFTLPRTDWLIACSQETAEAAAEKARELRSAGQSAAFLYGEGEESIRRRLARGEAERALVFTAGGVREVKGEA